MYSEIENNCSIGVNNGKNTSLVVYFIRFSSKCVNLTELNNVQYLKIFISILILHQLIGMLLSFWVNQYSSGEIDMNHKY